MTTPKKLEEIAGELDDLTLSIEEIEDEIGDAKAPVAPLEHARADIERAADLIEESLPDPPPLPEE